MTTPPTIGPGSTDQASVVAAQRDLNVADARERSAGRPGLSTCPLTESGVFDADTEIATIEFQALRGLTPDGIIGPDTWALLDNLVNPSSGIDASVALPLEGVSRWSVSLQDIAAQAGTAPSTDQLPGVTISVGGSAATNPVASPDGTLIFFTPPAGQDGTNDLIVTGGDGTAFTLPEAVSYSSDIPSGLEGIAVSVAVAVQEAALNGAALEVGRMQGFVDGAGAALTAYQILLNQVLGRLQAAAAGPAAADVAAWAAHTATRARMIEGIVNGQCRVTLVTDAIADLDGMPFAGADDQPTLDTGATMLLMTAMENVIVPSIVDLTA